MDIMPAGMTIIIIIIIIIAIIVLFQGSVDIS